jgi:hypothetical protein
MCLPRPPVQARGTGDERLMSLASPAGAIFSHCHPTVTFTGAFTDGVVHEMMTSRPRRSSPSVSAALAHVHVRPATSVTVRSAMVLLQSLEKRALVLLPSI